MKDEGLGSGFILLYSLAEETFRYGYYCLPHPLPPWGKGKGKRKGEGEGEREVGWGGWGV